MRDYIDGRVTSPKRVTTPTWGSPHPCKQALRQDDFKRIIGLDPLVRIMAYKLTQIYNIPRIQQRCVATKPLHFVYSSSSSKTACVTFSYEMFL